MFRKLKGVSGEQQLFVRVGTAIDSPRISQAKNDHKEGTPTHDKCVSLGFPEEQALDHILIT